MRVALIVEGTCLVQSGVTGGYCGDGTKQAGLGEACDSAAHNNCSSTCQCEDEGRSYGQSGNAAQPCRFCGDGVVSDGETCDTLNDSNCASDCGSCSNDTSHQRCLWLLW